MFVQSSPLPAKVECVMVRSPLHEVKCVASVDVELTRPSSGVTFRLSIKILWQRCPTTPMPGKLLIESPRKVISSDSRSITHGR